MDRYWLEITIETVPVLAEMSGEILLEAGCGGVICQDPPPGETGLSTRSYRVTGYLPLQDGCDRKIEEIKEHLAALDRFFPRGRMNRIPGPGSCCAGSKRKSGERIEEAFPAPIYRRCDHYPSLA